MVHIVLLIQFTDDPRSKKYEDFSTVHDCCRYICQLFENYLKKANPTLSEITYDITDLYEYIDNVRNRWKAWRSFRFILSFRYRT